FSLVFHVHEVEEPDQSLDRRQYQQGEKEMLGFGTLVCDEDFDPDYSQESHPDTHVRPHTRIVLRCARRHNATLPFERLSARSSNTSAEIRTSTRCPRNANRGWWSPCGSRPTGLGCNPKRLRQALLRRT